MLPSVKTAMVTLCCLGVERERAGAEDFDVVGMGSDGEMFMG